MSSGRLFLDRQGDISRWTTRKAWPSRAAKGWRGPGRWAFSFARRQRRLLMLRDVVDRLKQTNFRFRQDILDPYLGQQGDNN
jgi:hypothetical protein